MKVSVVIPTTDRSEGFLRCISSVIAQTYTNIEVIVVANNCKDTEVIPKIIGTLCDTRIKYVYLNDCLNANVARNYGAKISCGDYVAYMDSDDYWSENHIVDCLSLLQPGVNAIYSGYYIDDGISLRLKKSRAISHDESPLEFLFGADAGVAQTSSFFLSRNVFEKCKWDEQLKRNQDYDFFISVSDCFGWTYKESVSCYVFWALSAKRSFHYESYLIFFARYKSRMNCMSVANYAFELLFSCSLIGRCEYNRVKSDFPFERSLLPAKKKLFVVNYYVAVFGHALNSVFIKLKTFL